ncbi:MAG: PEP-CTERM sorting domain-containing protein [Betaproteobacteria bacterium]|nr:MAG: PEP-CTERM sorting domain-containing protein [Betaproteobacteria bacterium]
MLSGLYLYGTNLPGWQDVFEITYTIGNEASVSDLVFKQACVVDRIQPAILRGPADCQFKEPEIVSEPAALALVTTSLGVMGWVVRRKKRKQAAV